MAANSNAALTAKYLMDDAAATAERLIEGMAVSRGVGIGRVVFYANTLRTESYANPVEIIVEREIERFHSAVKDSSDQLRSLTIANESPEHLADILNIQLLILEQSSFVENVVVAIKDGRISSEEAVKLVTHDHAQRQSMVPDPHLREKRLDIEDVCQRILAVLEGPQMADHREYAGSIVAAYELRPSEVIELSRHNPAGILTERGGWTSHSAILAREFRIPMVSGIRDIASLEATPGHTIIDGENGVVIFTPRQGTVDAFSKRLATESATAVAGTLRSSHTLDGSKITIRANVDIPEAYHLARHFGAEGIGLFRSESLISRPGKLPTEDEQFAAYRKMAQVVGDEPLRIRTFDIGLDQLLDSGLHSEINPSLGLRSIRLSLREQEHFRAQIRAVLRASVDKRIDIVLPMISGVTEVLKARSIIDEERLELENRGIVIGSPGIGAMIEVPSGVFTANEIAREVDFLALGTNDLVQYLLAVDRDNDSVAEWYQTLHPGVIRAIRDVIRAANNASVPMLICGEMAGSAFYVPLLIGLGANELSMNVNSINQIRHLISGITLEKASEIGAIALAGTTSDEIEEKLRTFYHLNWEDLFPPGLLDAKHR